MINVSRALKELESRVHDFFDNEIELWPIIRAELPPQLYDREQSNDLPGDLRLLSFDAFLRLPSVGTGRESSIDGLIDDIIWESIVNVGPIAEAFEEEQSNAKHGELIIVNGRFDDNFAPVDVEGERIRERCIQAVRPNAMRGFPGTTAYDLLLAPPQPGECWRQKISCSIQGRCHCGLAGDECSSDPREVTVTPLRLSTPVEGYQVESRVTNDTKQVVGVVRLTCVVPDETLLDGYTDDDMYAIFAEDNTLQSVQIQEMIGEYGAKRALENGPLIIIDQWQKAPGLRGRGSGLAMLKALLIVSIIKHSVGTIAIHLHPSKYLDVDYSRMPKQMADEYHMEKDKLTEYWVSTVQEEISGLGMPKSIRFLTS